MNMTDHGSDNAGLGPDSASTASSPMLPMPDGHAGTRQGPGLEARAVEGVDDVRRTTRRSAEMARKTRRRSVAAGVPATIELDELDLLEAENRSLKKRLAERLRTENTQLRRMLERFAPATGRSL